MPEHMHLVTLLEQAGPGIVHDHYWDFGLFSNLYQSLRPVPADASLEQVLAQTKCDRWAQMLQHVHAHAAALCPHTVQAAYMQVLPPCLPACRLSSASWTLNALRGSSIIGLSEVCTRHMTMGT